MLAVWTDEVDAGRLEKHDAGAGASFAYRHDVTPERAVSLTMPARVASYEAPFGLHPVFDMNLPEGALRERLRLAFAKETGRFDDFDVLSITGRSQMGRVRYTGADALLQAEVPFQSVDEILHRRRDGALFAHLLERFAVYSGVSGVQPKVLIRDGTAVGVLDEVGRASVRGATHIVKMWDDAEYPWLGVTEFFCMRAAARAGLPVAKVQLAEDGKALVVDRFDLRPDGSYCGMEDFCALNGKGSKDKYDGGYEKAVFRRLKDYVVDAVAWRKDAAQLFTLFVLNCGVRNGDAHLKNFALLYDDPTGEARLSPAYDIVTTAAYLPQDKMALTLDGRPFWPTAKQLDQVGQMRAALSRAAVMAIRDKVAEAMAETRREVEAYWQEQQPGFEEVGRRMLDAWELGTATSLR